MTQTSPPYVGMWVTANREIRQELLADGRYDEARGKRQSAYTGRYAVRGSHINYVDDPGFTADGEFGAATSFITEAMCSFGRAARPTVMPPNGSVRAIGASAVVLAASGPRTNSKSGGQNPISITLFLHI